MLKIKPQPGAKIRCIDDGGFSFFTVGKIYEVINKEDTEDTVWFIDDDGDENTTNVPASWYNDEFELVEEITNTKQDEFRVGDTVWCLVHGKGEVSSIAGNPGGYTYPVEVCFENRNREGYTLDGKLIDDGTRTLFFSEPKIEASVTRPFVPTLVGKKVVVLEYACYPQVFTVEWENEDMFGNGTYTCAKGHSKVYEVSSENLLKKD